MSYTHTNVYDHAVCMSFKVHNCGTHGCVYEI